MIAAVECPVINEGRYIAENISFWYDEIACDFNIRQKVWHVVIDSGSNVKNAFLTLPEYLEDQIVNSEIDGNDDKEEYKAINISSERVTSEHHSCLAHTLQLVIKDGLKKAGHINTAIKGDQNSCDLYKDLLLQLISLEQRIDFKLTMSLGGIRS